MSNRITSIAVGTLAVLLLVGCTATTAEISASTDRPADSSVAIPSVQPGTQELPLTFASDDGASVEVTNLDRVMVLDDPTIEIAFALGVGDSISATPQDSWLEDFASQAQTRLPATGQNLLTVEGVIAIDPTLVIGTNANRQGDLIAGLRDVGIPAVLIDGTQPAPEKIRKTAEVFGVPEQGAELADAVVTQLEEAAKVASELSESPSAMVISLSGVGDSGSISAAGSNTPADQIITAGGATNAGGAAGIEVYQPLTPEGLIAGAPDVILVAADEIDDLGGEDGIWDFVPGLAATPAGQSRSLIVMPTMQLMGAGVSSGAGALTLANGLAQLEN